MRRALRVVMAVAVVLTTFGASPGSAQVDDGPARLVAYKWRLVRLEGSAVPAGAGMSIAFTRAGAISGWSGCNDFQGSWTHLEDDGISIGALSVTREVCRGAKGRLEDRYLDALFLATTFTLDGSQLTIGTSRGGSLVYRAGTRSGSELVGTWALSSVDGTAATDIPRTTVTFDDAGGVTGAGGCNAYAASYTVEDTAIRFRAVSVARATCTPRGMAQETAFLDGLEGARSWSVSGDALTLAGKSGRHALTLTAVRPVTYSLVDTDWTIDTTAGATVTADSTIRFGSDGMVSGWNGCNSFRGPWSLDDDGIVLHVGPLIATRATCAQDAMDMGASYLAALDDVIGYKTPGGTSLQLNTASGVRLTYTPPVTPALTSVTWSLAEILGSPFAGLEPVNIWFSDDGSLSGFGGCTLYSGTFELRADAIHIQDIAGGGGSGCEQSDADFEAAFLAILPYVSRMSFDGADLVLWSADQPIRFRSR